MSEHDPERVGKAVQELIDALLASGFEGVFNLKLDLTDDDEEESS